jgi:hypothetical protein
LLHVETVTKKRDISAELTEFEILLDRCVGRLLRISVQVLGL